MSISKRSDPNLPRFGRLLPKALRDCEAAEIAKRRSVVGVAADAGQVGVALSGGGIRSATFCLGVFQALARQGLIRKIDYLSTVSGGGYFGGFLGRMFSRSKSVDAVECDLARDDSDVVNWLRENGRFKKILTHLGLYPVRSKSPPRMPPKEFRLDCSYSQILAAAYLHANPE
jgi:hypothetical protein